MYSIAKSRVTMFLTKRTAKMCFRLLAAGELVEKSQTPTLKTGSFFLFLLFFPELFSIYSQDLTIVYSSFDILPSDSLFMLRRRLFSEAILLF